MEIKDQVIETAKILEDKKALNIVVIELKGLTSLTDYFIIATGEVDTHLDNLSQVVLRSLKNKHLRPGNPPAKASTGWVLLDYGDFIVHLFNSGLRSYYNLERIWGEGKIVWSSS